MDNLFFSHPILNSPYECPARHWELDQDGQPTQKIIEYRRSAEFITPIPKPRRRKQSNKPSFTQLAIVLDEGKGLSTSDQQYDPTGNINLVRKYVDQWRMIPDPNDWKVTPETARLLQHWRQHPFADIRPFFCQVEAVETLIWLTEVAPKGGKREKELLERMVRASHEANPELERIALKMATGSGKTTVMAMIIAWQTINALRYPTSKKFTRGFLVVTPGVTIRDRLRVLHPNDPDSYYANRELVPSDLLPELGKAKIVITNYHAFKLRERLPLSKGGRALLQGHGEALNTLETEGQMLQRVMPELMGMKNILAINDEAHHCYREKPEKEEEPLTVDDRQEAEANNEAARLWISGLEVIGKKLGLTQVVDIFTAAGLKKPDISILSDEFLAQIETMPQRNLAVELLRKLLSDEIKTRSRKNLVQSRSFAEMLERTIRAYQNRAIETAQVIEELIAMAKDMRSSDAHSRDLGLTEDEIAFYDALEINDSAVQVLGDETLKKIAQELVEMVHRNVTIDWTVRETVRARLRVMVKRILRKYGYPPDKQEKATQTVLEQAELLARDWVG